MWARSSTCSPGRSTGRSYLRCQVAPYLGREVLEVGAGLGATTQHLCRGEHDRWLCLEPDPALARRVEASIASGELPACCQVEVGTTHDRSGGEQFDTLLYIDVLEHIRDDAAEVATSVATAPSRRIPGRPLSRPPDALHII